MHTSSAAFDAADSVTALTVGHDAASVTIPDANFLFHAEFKRAGSDLALTGQDGHRVVIPGYFNHEHLPTLLSPDGAALTGDIVEALAGSMAPNQYAQAGAATLPSHVPAIGRVATSSGSVTALRNGTTVTLNTGEMVLKGDVIQTGSDSAVGVIFTDGTTFNLTSNARMVLNDFVYSPGSSSNHALVNLVQGSITFIAGEIAHTGDMRVGTPAATMGIRGTMVQVDIDVNNGQTKLAVLVEPNGATGSFNVYSLDGTLLGVVNDAGVTAVVTPTGPLQASFTEIAKTQAELQDALNIVNQVVHTQTVGTAIMQQQPLPSDGQHPTGTQITSGPTDISTTHIDVSVTAPPAGTPPGPVQITNVQVVQPPQPPAPPQPPSNPGPGNTHTDATHGPFVAHQIADESSAEDHQFCFQIPANTFGDADNLPLTLAATLASGAALPDWLHFNASTQTFFGHPPENFNGVIDVKVTADDGHSTASDSFQLNITPVNDRPVIHTQGGDIQYWASNTTGNVTPINHISFDDVDNSHTDHVHVTFTAADGCDKLTASDLTGSGLTLIGANGGSQITLDGNISDINNYLFNGHLLWNPDGANNHASGDILVQIDDLSGAPNSTACTTVSISEICDPNFNGNSTHDFSNVNFSGVCTVNLGSGCDTVTTSWNHAGTTTYNGGSGDDTINLLFTPDQLTEILSNTTTREALDSYLEDPCGQTLNLSGTSWNAEATGFEHAHIAIVTGYGSGDLTDVNFIQHPEYIIGTSNSGETLTPANNGDHVIVGLSGNDTLIGGCGNDALLGGAGNDTLIAGHGNDILSGGTGNDTFHFNSTPGGHADFGNDIIVDFHPGDDIIEISKSVFQNIQDLLCATSNDCHGNAVITVDCNSSITLSGVSKADIAAHQADIHLVPSGVQLNV